MKKVVIAFSILTSVMVLISCGGKGDKKEDKQEDKKETVKEEVKVSTEMQDFMNNLNGRSASVTAALQTFAKPDLDNKDMDMYDLKDPKVLEANGNCYLLQCASGMTKRKYNICWEGGKISSVEDKGME